MLESTFDAEEALRIHIQAERRKAKLDGIIETCLSFGADNARIMQELQEQEGVDAKRAQCLLEEYVSNTRAAQHA